jgi:hypothetical protein
VASAKGYAVSEQVMQMSSSCKKHSKTQMEMLLGSRRAVHVRGMGRVAKEGQTSTSHIPVYIQNTLFPVFL